MPGRPVRRCCWPVVLAGALVALVLVVQAENREDLEARLAELRQEIEVMQQRLDRDLGERDSRLQALASSEREVSRVRRAVQETEQALGRTRTEIERLNRRTTELEQDVSDHARRLGEQLAVAYRHGTGSRLKMLLNQDDPRRLSRQLAYHGYLSRARLEAMEQLNRSLAALAETGQALEAELDNRRSLLEQQRSELEELEAARATREQALRRLEGRIRDDRQRLEELENDAAELTRLIQELGAALADVPPELEVTPFNQLQGQLPLPVTGRVTRRFGEERAGDLKWNGWLIGAQSGQPVQAIAHGRVAYADWLRGYGLLLIIDHGDGYMSLYAHNESLLRDVGDWVGPGEVIATVGNSGGVDQAGVYFELRQDGRPINPARWLARQ